MNDEPVRVAIVGGGIGGLCLAQGLRQDGVDVHVYERDATAIARTQGFRVHISPTGSKALHDCLPPDLFGLFSDTCGVFGQGFTMASEQLVVLLGVANADGVIDDPVLRHRSVSRISLRRILLAGLEDRVHFGKRFTHYVDEPGGAVAAYFEDGTSAAADVLIAADGVNSPVRKQLLPGADPIDTGIVAVGGKVPLSPAVLAIAPAELLSGPVMILAREPVSLFMALWKRDLSRQWALNAALPATASDIADAAEEDYLLLGFGAKPETLGLTGDVGAVSGRELVDAVRKQVRNWHPSIRKLVELIDPESFGATRIKTSQAVEAWPTGRITLLGDAIHSMTPYRGIGANVALRDAALLRTKLAAAHRGEAELLTAIGEYESEMRVFGFAAVGRSLETMHRATSARGAGFGIMKGVMRTINAIPPVKRRIAARMAEAG
jgi:2-polyprenyl-6-methoxyphenol hydroxylase-like FAD-dependent oxidoreductase